MRRSVVVLKWRETLLHSSADGCGYLGSLARPSLTLDQDGRRPQPPAEPDRTTTPSRDARRGLHGVEFPYSGKAPRVGQIFPFSLSDCRPTLSAGSNLSSGCSGHNPYNERSDPPRGLKGVRDAAYHLVHHRRVHRRVDREGSCPRRSAHGLYRHHCVGHYRFFDWWPLGEVDLQASRGSNVPPGRITSVDRRRGCTVAHLGSSREIRSAPYVRRPRKFQGDTARGATR